MGGKMVVKKPTTSSNLVPTTEISTSQTFVTSNSMAFKDFNSVTSNSMVFKDFNAVTSNMSINYYVNMSGSQSNANQGYQNNLGQEYQSNINQEYQKTSGNIDGSYISGIKTYSPPVFQFAPIATTEETTFSNRYQPFISGIKEYSPPVFNFAPIATTEETTFSNRYPPFISGIKEYSPPVFNFDSLTTTNPLFVLPELQKSDQISSTIAFILQETSSLLPKSSVAGDEFHLKLKQNEEFLEDKFSLSTKGGLVFQTFEIAKTISEETEANTELITTSTLFTTKARPTPPDTLPEDTSTLTPAGEIVFKDTAGPEMNINVNATNVASNVDTTLVQTDEYGKLQTIQLVTDKTIRFGKSSPQLETTTDVFQEDEISTKSIQTEEDLDTDEDLTMSTKGVMSVASTIAESVFPDVTEDQTKKSHFHWFKKKTKSSSILQTEGTTILESGDAFDENALLATQSTISEINKLNSTVLTSESHSTMEQKGENVSGSTNGKQTTTEITTNATKEGSEGITTEMTEERSEELTKETRKEITKETTKQSSQEISTEMTEEGSEKITTERAEERTEERTTEMTKEGSEEITTEITTGRTKEKTEALTTEITKEGSEETISEMTEEITTETTEERSEEMTTEKTKERTEEITSEMTEERSEEITKERSEEITSETTKESTEEITTEMTEEINTKLTAILTSQTELATGFDNIDNIAASTTATTTETFEVFTQSNDLETNISPPKSLTSEIITELTTTSTSNFAETEENTIGTFTPTETSIAQTEFSVSANSEIISTSTESTTDTTYMSTETSIAQTEFSVSANSEIISTSAESSTDTTYMSTETSIAQTEFFLVTNSEIPSTNYFTTTPPTSEILQISEISEIPMLTTSEILTTKTNIKPGIIIDYGLPFSTIAINLSEVSTISENISSEISTSNLITSNLSIQPSTFLENETNVPSNIPVQPFEGIITNFGLEQTVASSTITNKINSDTVSFSKELTSGVTDFSTTPTRTLITETDRINLLTFSSEIFSTASFTNYSSENITIPLESFGQTESSATSTTSTTATQEFTKKLSELPSRPYSYENFVNESLLHTGQMHEEFVSDSGFNNQPSKNIENKGSSVAFSTSLKVTQNFLQNAQTILEVTSNPLTIEESSSQSTSSFSLMSSSLKDEINLTNHDNGSLTTGQSVSWSTEHFTTSEKMESESSIDTTTSIPSRDQNLTSYSVDNQILQSLTASSFLSTASSSITRTSSSFSTASSSFFTTSSSFSTTSFSNTTQHGINLTSEDVSHLTTKQNTTWSSEHFITTEKSEVATNIGPITLITSPDQNFTSFPVNTETSQRLLSSTTENTTILTTDHKEKTENVTVSTENMIKAIDNALKIFQSSTETPKDIPQIIKEALETAKSNETINSIVTPGFSTGASGATSEVFTTTNFGQRTETSKPQSETTMFSLTKESTSHRIDEVNNTHKVELEKNTETIVLPYFNLSSEVVSTKTSTPTNSQFVGSKEGNNLVSNGIFTKDYGITKNIGKFPNGMQYTTDIPRASVFISKDLFHFNHEPFETSTKETTKETTKEKTENLPINLQNLLSSTVGSTTKVAIVEKTTHEMQQMEIDQTSTSSGKKHTNGLKSSQSSQTNAQENSHSTDLDYENNDLTTSETYTKEWSKGTESTTSFMTETQGISTGNQKNSEVISMETPLFEPITRNTHKPKHGWFGRKSRITTLPPYKGKTFTSPDEEEDDTSLASEIVTANEGINKNTYTTLSHEKNHSFEIEFEGDITTRRSYESTEEELKTSTSANTEISSEHSPLTIFNQFTTFKSEEDHGMTIKLPELTHTTFKEGIFTNSDEIESSPVTEDEEFITTFYRTTTSVNQSQNHSENCVTCHQNETTVTEAEEFFTTPIKTTSTSSTSTKFSVNLDAKLTIPQSENNFLHEKITPQFHNLENILNSNLNGLNNAAGSEIVENLNPNINIPAIVAQVINAQMHPKSSTNLFDVNQDFTNFQITTEKTNQFLDNFQATVGNLATSTTENVLINQFKEETTILNAFESSTSSKTNLNDEFKESTRINTSNIIEISSTMHGISETESQSFEFTETDQKTEDTTIGLETTETEIFDSVDNILLSDFTTKTLSDTSKNTEIVNFPSTETEFQKISLLGEPSTMFSSINDYIQTTNSQEDKSESTISSTLISNTEKHEVFELTTFNVDRINLTNQATGIDFTKEEIVQQTEVTTLSPRISEIATFPVLSSDFTTKNLIFENSQSTETILSETIPIENVIPNQLTETTTVLSEYSTNLQDKQSESIKNSEFIDNTKSQETTDIIQETTSYNSTTFTTLSSEISKIGEMVSTSLTSNTDKITSIIEVTGTDFTKEQTEEATEEATFKPEITETEIFDNVDNILLTHFATPISIMNNSNQINEEITPASKTDNNEMTQSSNNEPSSSEFVVDTKTKETKETTLSSEISKIGVTGTDFSNEQTEEVTEEATFKPEITETEIFDNVDNILLTDFATPVSVMNNSNQTNEELTPTIKTETDNNEMTQSSSNEPTTISSLAENSFHPNTEFFVQDMYLLTEETTENLDRFFEPTTPFTFIPTATQNLDQEEIVMSPTTANSDLEIKALEDQNTPISLESLIKLVGALSHAIEELSSTLEETIKTSESSSSMGSSAVTTEISQKTTTESVTEVDTSSKLTELSTSALPSTSLTSSTNSIDKNTSQTSTISTTKFTFSSTKNPGEVSSSERNLPSSKNETKSIKNVWNKMINKIKQIGHSNSINNTTNASFNATTATLSSLSGLKGASTQNMKDILFGNRSIESATQVISSVNAIVINEVESSTGNANNTSTTSNFATSKKGSEEETSIVTSTSTIAIFLDGTTKSSTLTNILNVSNVSEAGSIASTLASDITMSKSEEFEPSTLSLTSQSTTVSSIAEVTVPGVTEITESTEFKFDTSTNIGTEIEDRMEDKEKDQQLIGEVSIEKDTNPSTIELSFSTANESNTIRETTTGLVGTTGATSVTVSQKYDTTEKTEATEQTDSTEQIITSENTKITEKTDATHSTDTTGTTFETDTTESSSALDMNQINNEVTIKPVIFLKTNPPESIGEFSNLNEITIANFPINIKLLLEEAGKAKNSTLNEIAIETTPESTIFNSDSLDITTLSSTFTKELTEQSNSQTDFASHTTASEFASTEKNQGEKHVLTTLFNPPSSIVEEHENLNMDYLGSESSEIESSTTEFGTSKQGIFQVNETNENTKSEDTQTFVSTSLSSTFTEELTQLSNSQTDFTSSTEFASTEKNQGEKHVLTTLFNPLSSIVEEHQDLNMHHLGSDGSAIQSSTTDFGSSKEENGSINETDENTTLEASQTLLSTSLSSTFTEEFTQSSNSQIDFASSTEFASTERNQGEKHVLTTLFNPPPSIVEEHQDLNMHHLVNESAAVQSTTEIGTGKEGKVQVNGTDENTKSEVTQTLELTHSSNSQTDFASNTEISSTFSQTISTTGQTDNSNDEFSSPQTTVELKSATSGIETSFLAVNSTTEEISYITNARSRVTLLPTTKITEVKSEITGTKTLAVTDSSTETTPESNFVIPEITKPHPTTTEQTTEFLSKANSVTHSTKSFPSESSTPEAIYINDSSKTTQHAPEKPKVLFTPKPPELIHEQIQNMHMHHITHTSPTTPKPTEKDQSINNITINFFKETTTKKARPLHKHRISTPLEVPTTETVTSSTSTTEAFYIIGNETCRYSPVDKNKNLSMTTNAVSTHKPVFIDLPTFWPNSTWPVPNFEQYYSTQYDANASQNDEQFDLTLNPFAFQHMKIVDFLNITEYPITTQINNFGNISAVTMKSRTSKSLELSSSVKTTERETSTVATTKIVVTTPRTTLITTTEDFSELCASSTKLLPILTSVSNNFATESSTTTTTTSPKPKISTPTVTTSTTELPSTLTTGSTTFPTTESPITSTISTSTRPSNNITSSIKTNPPTTNSTPQAPITIANVISSPSQQKPCDLQNDEHTCICSVDSMVKDLQEKSRNSNLSSILSNMCEIYIPLNATGIKVGRCINRMRRSPDDYDIDAQVTQKPKREIIASADIKDALGKDIELQETDFHKFATPGSKVRLICADGKNFTSNEYNIKWTVGKDTPLTDGKTLETGSGDLIIDNVGPSDGGNYSCSVTNHHAAMRIFRHQLSVITLPAMDINTTILYEVSVECWKEDEELLKVYFITAIGNMLCGKEHRICSIDITNCSCVNKQKSFLSIALVFHVEEMHVIVPTLNTTQCNVLCQMKIYAKLVNVIVNNILVFETQPVVYKHSRDVTLTPSKDTSLSSNLITESPKLIITCSAGYGLLEDKHLCSACEKNTYNNGGLARCIPCPSHHYQPYSGSRSCIKCTSPFQDPACMNMMILNVKKYKYYAYGALGAMVFIVLCIICIRCRRSKKQFDQGNNGKRKRSNFSDVEMQHTQIFEMKDKETLTQLSEKTNNSRKRARFQKATRAPPIPRKQDTSTTTMTMHPTIATLLQQSTANKNHPPTPPPPDF